MALCVAVLTGCDDKRPAPPPAGPPAPSVSLRVGVVNDAALATTLERQRGEWQAHSGDELVVEKLTTADKFTGDVLIFASRHLGELCEADRIRPVRDWVLKSDALALNDIARLVREREIVWNRQVMALPIGSSTPLLLGAEGAEFATWEQLNSLGKADPIAGGDFPYAFSFLARVAAKLDSSHGEAALLDAATLRPLITEPPFVEALIEAAASGDTVATMVLPLRSTERPPRGQVRMLPSSQRVFDLRRGEWQAAPTSTVPAVLVGGRGTLAAVTSTSRNAAAAFRLLEWVASPATVRNLQTTSPQVAPCRRGQAGVSDNWLPGGNSPPSFARANFEALDGPAALVVPRLIAVDEYLQSLDAAVRQVVTGETEPAEALAQVAAAWQQVTERVGIERQRQAFARHMGLSDL